MSKHITKSGLDKIESSPLDYWWHYLNPNRAPYEPEEKTIFDDAFRMAVLDPAGFMQKYVNQPAINKRSNYGKFEFAALESAISEKGQILLASSAKYPDKYNTILKMKAEVDKHPLCKLIFANGICPETVEFTDEDTGALIRFKSHWIDNDSNLIIHLMSTTDASEEQFSKDAFNFKNHKRAAIQLDGFASIGAPMDGFVFVNVERNAPYKISVLFLDERSISLGRSTYRENCETYVKCLAENKWPGLKETATPISLPEWAFKNR